jgi:hypothetical protein
MTVPMLWFVAGSAISRTICSVPMLSVLPPFKLENFETYDTIGEPRVNATYTSGVPGKSG